ncbi:MAG: response regulator, partial [Chthoniobacteraceae bacterium]
MSFLTKQRPAGNGSNQIRVLVIDDDQELCGLIKDYLEPFGYEVVAAHDGISGAERGVAETFDAIILDVMLPGIDGLEVLRRLRAHTTVPILMLTSRGEETDRIIGLELGADDYLPKTFSSRELLARLRAVTRRSSAVLPAAAEPPETEITVG